MVIEYCSTILILIILTQVYFIMNNRQKNNFSNIWSSVKDNEYRIKLNNFNKAVYKEWKDYVEDFNYDRKTKEVVIKSIDEPRALALVNLYLSHTNGDITMNEMFENNIINRSITKARKSKVVVEKLTNLIQENNVKKTHKIEDYTDVSREINENIIEEKTQNIETPIENDSIQESVNDIHDYTSCAIVNNKINSNIEFNYGGQIIENSGPIGAYGGNEFASPFSNF